MDLDTKKSVLRMIPYGLYVLTSGSHIGNYAAATVTWVSQASFDPPLVVVAVRIDSYIHTVISEEKTFALNILGKDQGELAFAYFKNPEVSEKTIGGQPYRAGLTGAPILKNVPAFFECDLVGSLEHGDHSVFLGEVVNVGHKMKPGGRPDDITLKLKDLGENIFYGG